MSERVLNIVDTVTGPIPPQTQGPASLSVLHTRLDRLVEEMGAPPWSRRLIFDERNLVTLIAAGPGGGNRPHWHPDFDEWWVVLAGHLRWELTGGRVLEAGPMDIVWAPRGTVHHIQNVGTGLSLRLAVSMPPGVHNYSDCQECGFADDGPRVYGTVEPVVPGAVNISDVVEGPIPPRSDNETWPNKLHTRLADVTDALGEPTWYERLLEDERNFVTIVGDSPGSGNRAHWHPDFDEWWVVMAGELQWELTGGETIRAAEGDIVWVPRGTVHHISNVGAGLSVRLAVAMPPGTHCFEPCESCGYSEDGPAVSRME